MIIVERLPAPILGKPIWYFGYEKPALGFFQAEVEHRGVTSFIIGLVDHKTILFTPPIYCCAAKPEEVRAGFVGIICTSTELGAGKIIEESFDGKELVVVVERHDHGRLSTRLSQLTLCCFSG